MLCNLCNSMKRNFWKLGGKHNRILTMLWMGMLLFFLYNSISPVSVLPASHLVSILFFLMTLGHYNRCKT